MNLKNTSNLALEGLSQKSIFDTDVVLFSALGLGAVLTLVQAWLSQRRIEKMQFSGKERS